MNRRDFFKLSGLSLIPFPFFAEKEETPKWINFHEEQPQDLTKVIILDKEILGYGNMECYSFLVGTFLYTKVNRIYLYIDFRYNKYINLSKNTEDGTLFFRHYSTDPDYCNNIRKIPWVKNVTKFHMTYPRDISMKYDSNSKTMWIPIEKNIPNTLPILP